jgi:hypothetical protein
VVGSLLTGVGCAFLVQRADGDREFSARLVGDDGVLSGIPRFLRPGVQSPKEFVSVIDFPTASSQ